MDLELLVRAAKALVEVAGFAYLGQGLVAVFAGNRREENFVFQIFRIVTGPVTKATRAIAPRFVPDRHIPFVGFGLLLWAWFILVIVLANLKRAG
ncbi:MAG TPA: hypothetical protein PLD37_02485 [Usitatibacteraceae bacterium]|nr:hypothetical protein [Usitatibacteraceae bacterium]